jgi:hypothetical protein
MQTVDNLRDQWAEAARTLQKQIDMLERGSLNATFAERDRMMMAKHLRGAVYDLAELQRLFGGG